MKIFVQNKIIQTCLCSFLSCQNCPHTSSDCLLPGHLLRQVWDFKSGDKSQIQIIISSGCPVFSFLTLWLTPSSQVTMWKHVQHKQWLFIDFPQKMFFLPSASWPCIDCIPICALTTVNVFPTTRMSPELMTLMSQCWPFTAWTIHRLSSPPQEQRRAHH